MNELRYWRNLVEGRWYDDTPTVTVYHGTSSALLEDIKQHGLRPPDNVADFADRVLHDYLADHEITSSLQDKIAKRVRSFREKMDMRGQHLGRSIYGYLIGSKERAAGYAQSYAVHGGEIAYDVWTEVKIWLGHDRVVPRFHSADPVVLTLEVPKAWVHAYQDFDELKRRLIQRWQEHAPFTEKFASFEEFVDDVVEMEVRIDRAVPPAMITDIEVVPPK